MKTIEFIYDRDCPNVTGTRAQLLRAFAEVGLPPRWVEWERGDTVSPTYVRDYGSPTVLVDGRDVAGEEPADGMSCCRLYADPSDGIQGVPSVQLIAAALQSADERIDSREQLGQSNGWRSSLAVLPGIGATLLPAGACPACWPAYAGVLSAIGLGFLVKPAYLLPLTVLFLLIAVGALGLRARISGSYGPFVVGSAASVIILVGKFVFALTAAMYAGIVLMVVASLWNARSRRAAGNGSGACPACAPGGQTSHSNHQGAKEVRS